MVNKHNVYNVGLKESENCPLPSHNAPKLPIRTPNDNTPVVIDPITGQLYTRDPQVSPADLEAAEKRLGKNLEQKVEEETSDVVRKGETSVASAPDKIVVRDSAGHINIQYPTVGSHGANKQYVDDHVRNVLEIVANVEDATADNLRDLSIDIDTKYADAKQYAENQIQAAVEAIVGDLAFTYESYEDFINSIMYTSDEGYLFFTGIISENGDEFTYDKLKKPGVQILIREKSVPDYWLSRLIIHATEDIINFFTEFETKVNLNDYYNKEEIEQKLEDLDTTKQLTGEEIENGTFKDGEQIYCTLSSDFFTANTYYIYVASSNSFKPISTSSTVTISPSISSLSVSTNPSSIGTVEKGATITIKSYTASFKKYADVSKISLTCSLEDNAYGPVYFGETEVTGKSVSVTGINRAISTSNAVITTAYFIDAEAVLKNNTGLYKTYSNISIVGRQYYGVIVDNPGLDTLTNNTATQYFGNKTEWTTTLKTSLSKTRLNDVTLNLAENSYVWFIIPAHQSINKMTSGGFDFPFVTQSNVTITNQYGVNILCKVYRSANKVVGDMTINLS